MIGKKSLPPEEMPGRFCVYQELGDLSICRKENWEVRLEEGLLSYSSYRISETFSI